MNRTPRVYQRRSANLFVSEMASVLGRTACGYGKLSQAGQRNWLAFGSGEAHHKPVGTGGKFA